MSNVWTVARQMIAEGIRMKVAVVFLLLIGAVVLGLPFSIEGDNSVSGAVQSFMSYAFTATAVLLGMLAIFLSRSLSDELVHRQIFFVMTKPIARWQYILGKWLGIALLNTAFLAGAGLAVYGMVQYIRYTRTYIDPKYDEGKLTNEILVARHAVRAKLPDFTREADAEFERNMEAGVYEENIKNNPRFSLADEKRRLAKKQEGMWRVVGPNAVRVFEFEHLLVKRGKGSFIQFRYKTDVANPPSDEVLRARFVFGNAFKGTPEFDVPVRHFIGRYQTMALPAACVAKDQTLTVRFYNQNPYHGEPQHPAVMQFPSANEVEVLFVVGSFGGNLLRLLALMQCKLMFLAAVGVLMTTWLSFPVAALASFTIYVVAGTRGFITEAFDMNLNDSAGMFTSVKDFLLQTFALVYNGMLIVLPDFGRFDAVESFVNGRNVPLVWVLQAMTDLAGIKTAIALGVAMFLFHRRELAEISL